MFVCQTTRRAVCARSSTKSRPGRPIYREHVHHIAKQKRTQNVMPCARVVNSSRAAAGTQRRLARCPLSAGTRTCARTISPPAAAKQANCQFLLRTATALSPDSTQVQAISARQVLRKQQVSGFIDPDTPRSSTHLARLVSSNRRWRRAGWQRASSALRSRSSDAPAARAPSSCPGGSRSSTPHDRPSAFARRLSSRCAPCCRLQSPWARIQLSPRLANR